TGFGCVPRSSRVDRGEREGFSRLAELKRRSPGGALATSLLTIGLATFAMGTFQQARAQETKLPGITVEGGGGGSKKKAQSAPAPKQAAKPAPAPASVPAPPGAAAPTEAMYQTPAAVSSVGQSEIQTFGQGGDIENV